jgi:hypothetical protein
MGRILSSRRSPIALASKYNEESASRVTGFPAMRITTMATSCGREWIHRLIPAALVVNILAVLAAFLIPAVNKARNDAFSAATT